MPDNAVRIAVIGAGPSGFYAAAALTLQKDIEVRVDLFDRLPAPYGLVRYGVAPDHPKIKTVTNLYDKTAQDPRVRFFGNVSFGRDLNLDNMRPIYDMVLFCSGAQSDRAMGVPGENLPGSISATEFVAWYNGHPDYANLNPDLSCTGVAVVGVGNVAMDVARILAKTVDELRGTDIAEHALEALSRSKVKNIYVLGRRGPAQAKFTNTEIKEFGHLADADPVVLPAELELDPHSRQTVEQDKIARQNVDVLREFAARGAGSKSRKVHFRFLVSPVEVVGRNGRAAALRIERNKLESSQDGYLEAKGSGQFETLETGLVLRSVGYMGVPLPGVPFDKRKGTIPNDHGRVLNPETGKLVPGAYVAGWAKRGPSGVIGTNKKDAEETVAQMLQDIPNLRRANVASGGGDVAELLKQKGVKYVTFADWQKINEAELARGKQAARPRVKLTTLEQMLGAL